MEEVEAQFVTDLPEHYRIPSSSYSLPTTVTPEALNELISQQLSAPSKFLFTLQNTILTGPLKVHLEQLHLSSESVLQIWYGLALPTPETVGSQQTEDWVSGCGFLSSTVVCCSDYSGNLSLYKDMSPLRSDPLHVHPIKDLALSPEGTGLIATGSKDGTLKISTFRRDDLEVMAEGKLGNIEKLAWNPTGTMVASGLFNGEVWISSINLEESAMITKASKRQKLSTYGVHSQKLSVTHADVVSGLQWPELNLVFTASHDHSVLLWDVSQEASVFSYTAPRAIQCFHAAERLFACGLENGQVKIVDDRTSQTVSTFTSSAWIRAIQWFRGCIVSGDENGELKIWDIRANVPVHTDKKHTEKILSLACSENTILTGGADCSIQWHLLSD